MDAFDVNYLLMALVALILGVTVHECAHAFVALQLGDDTAAREGRVTLNPVAHFDPLGGFMLLMVILGSAPIGWGKPVPINPYRIRGGYRGMAWSSLAGPLSNLLLAAVFALPLHLLSQQTLSPALRDFLFIVVIMNISLAAFNVVPLPPLDGFNTLIGFLPNQWVLILEPLRKPAMGVLMALILLPWLARLMNTTLDVDILAAMVEPLRLGLLQQMLPIGGCCYCVGAEDCDE